MRCIYLVIVTRYMAFAVLYTWLTQIIGRFWNSSTFFCGFMVLRLQLLVDTNFDKLCSDFG